jgi:hypothetical protein
VGYAFSPTTGGQKLPLLSNQVVKVLYLARVTLIQLNLALNESHSSLHTTSIYQNAPRTNSQAYGEAQKALKIQEEMTFSDEEIDQFLPTTLRKKTKSSK